MWVPNGLDVGAPHTSSQFNCPAVQSLDVILLFRKSENLVREEVGNGGECDQNKWHTIWKGHNKIVFAINIY